MITLALYEKMAEDAVAGLVKDYTNPNRNFFWEEAPLQADGKPAQGVWLVTRGYAGATGNRKVNVRNTADIYVAFSDKVQTEVTHKLIRDWISANKGFCELSGSVDGTSYTYYNVRMRPTTTPENVGATKNGVIVKVSSVELIYDEIKL